MGRRRAPEPPGLVQAGIAPIRRRDFVRNTPTKQTVPELRAALAHRAQCAADDGDAPERTIEPLDWRGNPGIYENVL